MNEKEAVGRLAEPQDEAIARPAAPPPHMLRTLKQEPYRGGTQQPPAPFEHHRADQQELMQPEFPAELTAAQAALNGGSHEKIGEEVKAPVVPGVVQIEVEQGEHGQRPAERSDEVYFAPA